MSFTIGIDLGTTATKVVVFDAGAERVTAVVELPSATSSPAPAWSEADPEEWWANVCSLVPRALAAAGIAAADVGAVATTSMIPAVIPTSDDGRPLRAAILQNDARASAEIATMATALIGVDMLGDTGSPLTQQSVGPTWRWLATHEPAVANATRYLLGGGEWLAGRLGAEPLLEVNWALESGLYHLGAATSTEAGAGASAAGSPHSAVLDAAQLDRRLLPSVVPSGAVVGQVSRFAAAATGLRVGTPIVAGGADHVLSAAAAGVGRPGVGLVKLGGAGDLLVYSERPVVDARLYLDAHPEPGAWLPNGCMATSGSLLRWVQRLVGGTDLAALDAAAAARPPADLLCLPHLLGEKTPVHDPDLRGAFVGLHLGHEAADLHRAALEGVAFGFRWMLEAFVGAGLDPATILVANGGSASTLWKQIIADVLDRPLLPVLDHPGAAYGAALSAAIGIGALPGWPHAAALARTGPPLTPSPDRRARYDDAYATWRDAIDALTPVSHRLARR